ncbi:MAG TPA: CoA transferase [Dehalococcoidia bacterium]|nr:CoA transferase [Dehalococcoidia bacterium]
MAGALDGIRILDFTMFQQGAEGTRMLADMGADVLKVEPNLLGDLGRYMTVLGDDLFSPYFFAHNRGKRAIALNLKTEEGREIVLKLASEVDVVTHNFRPGVMEKLGLTYDDIRAVNPDVIYAFATAWGTRGDRAPEPGFDLAGQAMGGLVSVTGDGEFPVPAGAAIADYTGAMHLALGVVTALFVRERTGKGQCLDVSLLGSVVAMQGWEMTYHLITGTKGQKAGKGHRLVPTIWRVFKTKDSFIVICGVGDSRWPALLRVTGLEHLADDPRFADHFARSANLDELHELLQEVFLKKTNEDWMNLFKPEDLIYAPVMTYEEIAKDPQARLNDYIVTIDHPTRGKLDVTGLPINFTETPVTPGATAPELGQHTEEVLLALGYSWDDVGALREKKVI